MNGHTIRSIVVGMVSCYALQSSVAFAQEDSEEAPLEGEPMVVEGERLDSFTTDYASPSIEVSAEQIERYNAVTIEDTLRYQPSLIVRRRYIGDPNGVVGIRGSNMFQTTRSMVFADGLPLHYLLQTRFSGAPRWSIAGLDEIDYVDVVYGPFSAEYSGNSMGGVVNIHTKMPEGPQLYADAAYFFQPYDFNGFDETVDGHREFASFGNKWGKFSAYFFYNHLENESQPMSFRRDVSAGGFGAAAGEMPVSGAFRKTDELGSPAIVYGDTGIEDVDTDLIKLKFGYDITPNLLAMFTVAYEDRDRETNDPNNYIRDAAGNIIWGDGDSGTTDAVFNGEAFTVRNDRFAVSDSTRRSVLVGGQLKGALVDDWGIDTTVSYFNVLEDESRQSNVNPADPLFDGSGRVTDFGDTGWMTYDLKVDKSTVFGRDDLSVLLGYHYDHYELEIRQFNSNNFSSGTRDSFRNASGGKTQTHALFGQFRWDFFPDWDATAGLRWERWETEDGFLDDGTTRVVVGDRDESKFSPKFSLGYEPGRWKFRYSFAKAYRFPIVGELFENAFDVAGTRLANSTLEPEDGIHHNFSVAYEFDNGYAQVNAFHENIDNVIFNQTFPTDDISSFLPIDEVRTTGVEMIFDQKRVFGSNFDFGFNVSYLDNEIEEHRENPAIEGNEIPRLPDWRVNFFSTYHITEAWEVSLGGRYQSDSFGDIENAESVDDVFGAQSPFFFVDFKTTYYPTFVDGHVSFGVDNVNNDDDAFVFHPWPQRTFYLEAALAF